MTVILISGCGVSAVLENKEGVAWWKDSCVLWWIDRIIAKGGFPTIQYLTDGASHG